MEKQPCGLKGIRDQRNEVRSGWTLYAASQGSVGGPRDEKKTIVAIEPESKKVTVIATDVTPNDLVVSKSGWIYFTDTGAGQVMMCPTQTQKLPRPRVAAGGINKPNGIGLSPDGKFLIVSEYGGTNAWNFMVNADGTLWAANATWSCARRESAGQRWGRDDRGSGGAAVYHQLRRHSDVRRDRAIGRCDREAQ